jgi:nucleotide-binding universal stress UspA family protein
MIKDILVNVIPNSPVADYAISMAAEFKAHLAGVAISCEPIVPGTIFDGYAATLMAQHADENRQAAQEVRAGFEELARKYAVAAEGHVIAGSIADVADGFARMARSYDLSVLPQSRPDGTGLETMIIEAALFGSGRPLLIVPYIQRSGLKLGRAMACWDGSRNAARAINDAMPLLRRTSQIDVVTITHDERRNEIAGADIAQHLARHGLKVEVKSIVDRDDNVSATILSYAADSGTDLIVMGGFGHSRLREFVLGGATRGMLESMTVPTLMAH